MNTRLTLHLFVSFLISGINSETIGETSGETKISDFVISYIHSDLFEDLLEKLRYSTNDLELDHLPNDSLASCLKELLRFWDASNKNTQATYSDSFGKVGAGILTGNVVYLGYYDECIDIGNTDYCLFPFDITTVFNNNAVTIPFQLGMCFPSSCDAKDFYSLFLIDSNSEVLYSKSFTADHYVNSMPTSEINIKAISKYRPPMCPWRGLTWTTSSIIVLAVCILLIALVIVGTVIDVLLRFVIRKLYQPAKQSENVTHTTPYQCEIKQSSNEDEPLINAKFKLNRKKSRCYEFIKDFILSFSLYNTLPAIMATHQPANAITSVHGIKVISMFWVILGHTVVWALQFNVVTNVLEVFQTVPKRFLFQIVDNAFFAVDSFFVLSGLLLSFLSVKEIEQRRGKFPFISFYVHRLLRLSPSYYFVVFFYFKVLPHVGSGAVWLLRDYDQCGKYWWTNILYINNFHPTIPINQCYIVTWYLATDMQFFIISPIFLLLLYHFWEIGFTTIVGTMLASIAIIGTLTGIKNPNANLAQDLINPYNFATSSIYQKPYCRINAYLIGIILGYMLYKKWRMRFNLWLLICFYSVLWILAAVCCLTMVFGEYQTWNDHPFTKTENVMYYMFSRTIFSIGVALIIYACHNGFGGVVNRILSWNFWIPLSRLTFMAYLCHPIVLSLMYGTMRSRFIYTDWLLMVLFAAAVTLSYSLALVLAVTVEYPIANVENAVYKFIGIKRRK